MAKHIWPESKPQPSTAQKLKAIGYGTLAVITSLAILIIATSLAFTGAGFLFAKLININAPDLQGLGNFINWFEYTSGTSLILGPLLSIYPIIKIAGPIFATAKKHWNNN